MQSRWIDPTRRRPSIATPRPASARDLALRVYTTRLLGGDPAGAARRRQHLGQDADGRPRRRGRRGAVRQGHGWDMADIEPAGLPAVRLEPLRKLRARDDARRRGDGRLQRANLIDPAAPNPSVETLLHAFLPHKFVDHTHATARAEPDRPARRRGRCARALRRPRRHRALRHARASGSPRRRPQVFDADPNVEGLVLHKHGIFTFGDERARSLRAHDRDGDARRRRAARAAARRCSSAAQLPQRSRRVAEVAPILRGACSLPRPAHEGAWRRPVLDFRGGDAVLDFVNGAELARYASAGVVTPDHTIRTKN